jgi:8-oxo-dGTP diphosphatase
LTPAFASGIDVRWKSPIFRGPKGGADMTESRTYPTRPILAASCAVFRDGKVLLASRGRPPFLDVYTLPGGLVELGEKLEEAALRELQEETGVVAEIIGLTGHSDVIVRDDDGRVKTHFLVASFAGRWISGEGEPGEELPVVLWTDMAGAEALTLTPNLAPILRRGFAMSKSPE